MSVCYINTYIYVYVYVGLNVGVIFLASGDNTSDEGSLVS